MRRLAALLLLASASPLAVPALAQTVPATEIAKITDEGTARSQVMVTAQQLTDVIGPRLTNSPGMRKAEQWTQEQFREWGLTNVHKEGFEFGRGWWIERSSVRMVAPRPIQLTAIPLAWTPATNGPLTAPIVVAPMEKESHFAQWRGKLAGKIVLVSQPDNGSEPSEAPFQRLSDEDIAKLDSYKEPVWNPERYATQMKKAAFDSKLAAFLKAEGAVAYAAMSYRDGKLLHGEAYLHRTGETVSIPGVEIAAEDYRRLARLARSGAAPTLEIDNDVRFDDSDSKAYNILADIKGSDPKAGYVMAGAHLDSWVAGDGASDNAAGSAMIMEAARILSALKVKPKRTIRFALWNGEEQALLGSIAYIEQHLATRPAPAGPQNSNEFYYSWDKRFPITPKPGYRDLAAYFNIDNGSGKLRGIYAENNPAVVPIFREWLAPFASMGADNVVIQRTGGTDHQFIQSIGLPGYQFIQDPLDYESRIHHSGADTFDHLKGADMRQGSIILAAMLLNAANADKPLPTMPLPTQPGVTDPFATPKPEAE